MSRVLPVLLLAALIASPGCGGEEEPVAKPPPAKSPEGVPDGQPRLGENLGHVRDDLPVLVVPTPSTPVFPAGVGKLLLQLMETQTPTRELVADLPGGTDERTMAVIDTLRNGARRNVGWVVRSRPGSPAERRCCLAEALAWPRGIEVEVHQLSLPEALADKYADPGGFKPLRGTKQACLRAAADGGHLRASLRPIFLRGGETARLTAAWTRARLRTRVHDGKIDESCNDRHVGLRMDVTAHVTGGISGTWELGAFALWQGLDDEIRPKRSGDTVSQDASGAFDMHVPKDNRLSVTAQETCWMARTRKPPGYESGVQILVCATLVD